MTFQAERNITIGTDVYTAGDPIRQTEEFKNWWEATGGVMTIAKKEQIVVRELGAAVKSIEPRNKALPDMTLKELKEEAGRRGLVFPKEMKTKTQVLAFIESTEMVEVDPAESKEAEFVDFEGRQSNIEENEE